MEILCVMAAAPENETHDRRDRALEEWRARSRKLVALQRERITDLHEEEESESAREEHDFRQAASSRVPRLQSDPRTSM